MDPCEDTTYNPKFQDKKINIFISSTFRDMIAERDELMTRIFPYIRKECENHDIAFSEVDLRWGIPKEKTGEALKICLKFIDECRPYFIGMLGERYGWVDESFSESIIKDYPWIKDHSEHSITELEIIHGVLNNPSMKNYAYFYLRDKKFLNTLSEINQQYFRAENKNDEKKLIALKTRICESGFPVRENYSNPIMFGELVKIDLLSIILFICIKTDPELNKKYSNKLKIPNLNEASPKDRSDIISNELKAENVKIKEKYDLINQNNLKILKFHDLLDVSNAIQKIIDSFKADTTYLSDEEKASYNLNREGTIHETYAQNRHDVYISRPGYFESLDLHVSGNFKPKIVYGNSGLGKSALLAHWVFRYREKHPDDLVIFHFIGASQGSVNLTLMLRRIMGEIKRAFELSEIIPDSDEMVKETFGKWLYIAAAKGRTVLVIDALDQLDDRYGAQDLTWLPPKIPKNIRIILSSLPGKILEEGKKLEFSVLEVLPLSYEERKRLIVCYLKKFHRELSEKDRDIIANAPQTENPLFLRTLLEELRIEGEFDNLSDQIINYLSIKNETDLFTAVLERCEKDYQRDRPELVKDSLSFIFASRQGLTKDELMGLLGTNNKPLPDAIWAPFYLAIEHSLVKKNNRISFFHDFLRKAVENKYFKEDQSKTITHLKIAEFFEDSVNLRKIEEYPWQLTETFQWEKLIHYLSATSSKEDIIKMEENDLYYYWKKIEDSLKIHAPSTYDPIIINKKEDLEYLLKIRTLYFQLGHIDESYHLTEYILNNLTNENLIIQKSKYQSKTRKLNLNNQNFWKNSHLFYTIFKINPQFFFKRIFTIVLFGDQKLGKYQTDLIKLNLHLSQLEYLRYKDVFQTISLLQPIEKICWDSLNIKAICDYYSLLGLILSNQKKYKKAIKLFRSVERISKIVGDMSNLQYSLGNQANIFAKLGNFDKAMQLHVKEERICRQYGYQDGLLNTLGNQGTILNNYGDYSGALNKFEEFDKICEDIGNPIKQTTGLFNRSSMLFYLKRFDDALIIVNNCENRCRELKLPGKLINSLYLKGQIYIFMDKLDLSKKSMLEAIEIAKEHNSSLINDIQKTLNKIEKFERGEDVRFYLSSRTIFV